MQLTETAMQNYQLLFANHSSRLDETDPEFLQLYANFTFGEALTHGQLEMKTRLMVILAALVARHALSEYRVMMNAALNVGVTPVEIKEIVYHSVPYAGSAFVFDFIHATNDILAERGFSPLQEGQSTTDQQTRFEKGLAVQKAFAVMRLLTSFTKTHQKISSIFSAIFLPTASAISIPAAVWICSSGS